MRQAVVAGVAMTAFGKFPDRGLRSLAEAAVAGVVEDAGASIPQIEMVFFGNAAAGLITGQEMIRGQAALRHTGLMGKPIINVENACASGATALHLAWMAVASGQVDVALAVGAEKLSHADKRVTFGALEAGVDLEELAELKQRVAATGDGQPKSVFMDIYAAKTRVWMAKSGATDADLAQVAVKSHHAASRNPLAQYRDEVTAAEVLASRAVSPPITLLMCAPIADGAAAVVVTTPEIARRWGAAAVAIRASVLVSGSGDTGQAVGATRAAERAYAMAGLGPEDVHVVEVHDATASAELMLYEQIGLCPPLGAAELLRSGATALGGRVPVNPSGGLLSKGHPVGATGCAQVFELVTQLRGRAGSRQREGARVALAENGGGTVGPDLAVASITILAA